MDNQEKRNKKFYESCWFWGIVVFIFLIIMGSIGKDDKSESSSTSSAPTSPNTQNMNVAQDKVGAQKELDDLIATAKKANLVESYEFSDSATVVYVTNVWNTQTVQFKKDFMAKVGMLKKEITGYAHLEVRNAYTDEKVGEIEAFSKELKVYK